MPQDPIAELQAKYSGAKSSGSKSGGGARPNRLPGSIQVNQDIEIEPFEVTDDVIEGLKAKYGTISGPQPGEPGYQPSYGYGQQNYDAGGNSQNPPSVVKSGKETPQQTRAKVVIDGVVQAPKIVGIPIEKSNAQGGDRTQYGQTRPTYKDPNLLDALVPGVGKFMREVETAGGNPRTMLSNREAAEEKRRVKLRQEKEKLSNDINKAMMQGASKDSDFVKNGYRRLYDIDQALGAGPAPSIIKSGKAATQATTKARVRITDETGGKETGDQRRSRLTTEFNYIGGALNELGQDIGKAKIVMDSGTERLTRLKGLIDQGQADLIPEYNDLVKRVQGIASSSQKKIDDYNALIQRAKPVGKAIDEYSAASRKKTQVTQQLSRAEQFVNAAAKLFGMPGFEEKVASTGSLGGDVAAAVFQAGGRAIEAIQSFPGAASEASGNALSSVGPGIKSASNAISQIAGLGPIDESIYKNDRAVQITQTLGEFAPYLLPGLGQALMGLQGAMIGGAAVYDPAGTAKSVLDSINPFAEGLRPEERGVRALSMLMLAGAGKVKLSEALLKRNLMKSYGMTEVGANQILDWARQTVKQGAGGGVKGDVLYYLETLKGTKIGKVANQTAEYWHQQYQKFLAEGAQFAKDAKKAGATTTSATDVVEGTPLTGNVRPQTNAPELPGRNPVPSSATKQIDILGPKGEPSGWKLAATADRVQLINADGGTLEFPFTPGDNPSYQQALAQARAHAEGNAPATIQPEPTMPPAPSPGQIAWTDQVFFDHVSKLLTNPEGKLFYGGESFAGKPVSSVPLPYAKTLLEGWKQQYDSLPNGETKAKMAHDMSLLDTHVTEQTALAEQAKAQAEANKPEVNPITNEPMGGVKTAAAEGAKADPTGAWNNVQKYDLAKAKETDLASNGGYKEVPGTGRYVGPANGGVGMFTPGEGKSYFFPFNDDEEGARNAAMEWAKANPAGNNSNQQADVETDSKPIKPTVDTKVPKGTPVATGKLFSGGGYSIWNEGTSEDPRYVIKTPDSVLTKFYTDWNAAVAKYKSLTGVAATDEEGKQPETKQGPHKVGDTFSYGGRDYRVVEINEDEAFLMDKGLQIPVRFKVNRDNDKYGLDWPSNKTESETKPTTGQFSDGTQANIAEIEKEKAKVLDFYKNVIPQAWLAEKGEWSKYKVGNNGDGFFARSYLTVPGLGRVKLTASDWTGNGFETVRAYKPRRNTSDPTDTVWDLIEPLPKQFEGLLGTPSNKTSKDSEPTQVKDEPKTEAPSNARQIKTGDPITNILQEFDNNNAGEIAELATDLKRMIEKAISLWDENWAEKEALRSSLIKKINDMLYSNAPMESPLFEMSSDAAQEIAELYIKKPTSQPASNSPVDSAPGSEKAKDLYDVLLQFDKNPRADLIAFSVKLKTALSDEGDFYKLRNQDARRRLINELSGFIYTNAPEGSPLKDGAMSGKAAEAVIYHAVKQDTGFDFLEAMLDLREDLIKNKPLQNSLLTDNFDVEFKSQWTVGIAQVLTDLLRTNGVGAKIWDDDIRDYFNQVRTQVLREIKGKRDGESQEPKNEVKAALDEVVKSGMDVIDSLTADDFDSMLFDARAEQTQGIVDQAKEDAKQPPEPKPKEVKVGSSKTMSAGFSKDLDAVAQSIGKNKKIVDALADPDNYARLITIADVNTIVWEEAIVNQVEVAESEGRSKEDIKNLAALAGDQDAFIGLLRQIRDVLNENRPPAPRTEPKAPKAPASTIPGVEDAKGNVAFLQDLFGNLQEETKYIGNSNEPVRAIGTNDANKERIKLGETRLDRLVSRYGGTVAGQAIVASFVRGDSADLKDQLVTSTSDLAAIAQPLRDPGIEVFHWVFTKGDRIVHAEAFSARLPSTTYIFKNRKVDEVIKYIWDTVDKHGADGVYMLHNHPSGVPEPSNADAVITGDVRQVLKSRPGLFKGHVIINSNKYGVIDADGKVSVRSRKFHTTDPLKLSKAEIASQPAGWLVDTPLTSIGQLADIAKRVESSDKAVIISVTARNKVAAVSTIPINEIADKALKQSAKRTAAWLSKFAKVSGGSQTYIVLTAEQAKRIENDYSVAGLKAALTTNLLTDVIVDGTSARKSNGISFLDDVWSLGRDVKLTRNVREERTPFIDQAVYAVAKPRMDELFEEFSATGRELMDFVRELVKIFPPSANPYLKQFLLDKQAERATIGQKETQNANDQRERDQLDGDTETPESTGGKGKQPDVRPGGRGGKPVQGDGVSTDAPVGTDGRPREDDLEGSRGGGKGSSKRPAKNFVITDELGLGETTDGQKKRDLIAALELRQVLRNENRQPTKDEQGILARFPGTGWIGNRLNETESTDPEFRDKIKSLISAAELINFRRSLVNSHYTSIPLIDVHWDIAKRLGYKGGPAVETSAGIGHFLGRAPKGAEITAIEFEDTAAEIMGWLYPESNVIHSPFEKVPAYGDKLLAISNIPFAIGISDYDLQKEVGITGSSIRSHNYFFMKALDHIVEGGLVIFTTSAGTLNARDAQARQTREYLASKADFIGAIRLPNNAFSQNAATDVTTDIVIMRKRPEGAPNRSQRFTQLADVITKDGDTATINQYFVDHPEMVLGTHSMRGVMYGRAQNEDGKFTNYTLNPVDGDLGELIKAAIERLPRNILGDVELKDSKTKMDIPKVVPPSELRTYRMFEHEGEFYLKTGIHTSEPITKQSGSSKGSPLGAAEKKQLRAYMAVRDQVRNLLDKNASTEGEQELKVAQANLKAVYDDYIKSFKRFAETPNRSILAVDEDWPTVKALEVLGSDGKKVSGLAPIFTQRVIKYHAKIDKVDNATDALLASIHNFGKVDLGEMSKMSGIPEATLISELSAQIFNDPKLDKWVTADEYGSGNVKAKYKEAKELAEIDETYKAHVDFLETRLPEDIKADDIFVQIGAKWVPAENYNQFVIDVFGYNPGIEFDDDGRFVVNNREPGTDLRVYVTEVQDVGDGTTRVVQGDSHAFSDVLQIALSNKAARIMKVEERGEAPKFQPALTQAVNERIALLREEWNYYWKGDDKLSKEIAQLYNDTVNVYQFRTYDGSFLTLPGSTATMGGRQFNLRPWQKDQILRTIVNDFAYAAHGVGTGKTFEIIGGAMELRRIGKRNKILIATLKANKEAIAADFLKMYPDARILLSQESSMTPSKRKEFLGRIQTGDYDAIIMHHDQFKKVPISLERAERIIIEQIQDLRKRLEARGGTDKQIEKSIKALEDKLTSERKRLAEWQDVGIFFEDLGIDHIMVDEAHYYRNVAIGSEEQGFSSKGSQFANDMLAKTDYLREIKGGATFFSGTPVVNSISEVYAIFRFMVPEFMAQTQTRSFDDWRTMYAELITKTERTITGAYKSKSSLFSFNNLTELKIQLRNFMDIKTTQDMSKVTVDGSLVMKLPQLRDLSGKITGEPITVQSNPSKWQDSYFIFSKARAENIEYPVQPGGDNVLNIATDNRKASNSIKMIDPTLPEEEDGKIMKAIKTIVDVYNLPESKKNNATQLVFLDQGTPKPKVKPPENLYFYDLSESEAQDASNRIDLAGYEPLMQEVTDEDGVTSWTVTPDDSDRFELYQFMKDGLVAGGIPENEIAFIHDYVSDAARTGLFADMNAGRKRIMFASTKKGGVGVNVQERALAVHNIDCPWTPADREQRIGRVWRQGNIFESIMLFDHMTVNSFDGFMYTKVAKKGGMIALLFSNDLKARTITDDVSDDAEMLERQAAIASGRQDILEYENIKREYKSIQSQASAHEMAQRKMELRMSSMDSDIARAADAIDQAEIKHKKYKEFFGDKFSATIGGETFDSPKAFGEKIVEELKAAIKANGAVVPGTQIRVFGYSAKITVNEWDLKVTFECVKWLGDSLTFQVKAVIDKYPYSEYLTITTYDKSPSDGVKELLSRIDPLGFVQRIRNLVDEPLDLIRQAKNHRNNLLDEKIALEKNIGKKFAKLEQLEDLRAKFEAMDATVGAEIRSGNSGQFGSGEDVLPEGYWEELYSKKAAQKAAKEGLSEAAEEANGNESKVNFAFTPGGKGAPKTPPSSTPSSVAPLSDKIENRWNWYDNILRFMAPGSRDGGARRAEIWLRSLHGDRARVEAVIGHVLSDLQRHLDRVPKEVAYEFIDAIEDPYRYDKQKGKWVGTRVPGANEKIAKVFTKQAIDSIIQLAGKDVADNMTFQDAADFIRATLDALREEINSVDPTKLNEFIEFYFPHIWKDQKTALTKMQDWMSESLGVKGRMPGAGKRPIEGSKSFLKKRTIPTIKEGLEMGLEPISDNPVDLLMLKVREMNKFIIATRFKETLKANGQLLFVPLGQRAGQGFEKINSTFFDVYSPGEINVKFAFDQKMMDSLMNLATTIGVDVEYVNSAGRARKGGTVWGYQSGDEIKMRYGSTLEALTHEIGHALDDKFGITNMFKAGAKGKKGEEKTPRDIIEMQLRSLGELRYESVDDPGEAYKSYTSKPEELTANFIHLYVHAKSLVKQFAPDALKAFTDFKKGNKTLGMLDKIEGGAEIGEMEAVYKVFGRTYTGSYYAPSGVAQVINNYLSPGISGSDRPLLRDAYQWFRVMNNSLNSIQLGFDGFHGLVTMLNATMTEVDVAVGYMEAGDFPKALKSGLIGYSLIGPMTVGWKRGSKIREAYLSATVSDPKMKELVEWITLAGGRATPDPVYLNDMRRKLRIAWRDKKNFDNWKSGIPNVPAKIAQLAWYGLHSFNEATSHWLMESLVPSLKLYAFEQLASVEMAKLTKQKPNFTFEDQQATLQRAWDSIDNRFGQMVYDNLFFDKIVKDTATITFRAFGWNYGTIREVGGSVVDAGKQVKGMIGGGGGKPPAGGGLPAMPGDPDEPPFVPDGLTPRQRYSWIAMTSITALVAAIITKLATGENPRELRDYQFPRTGRLNPDGTPERMALPTYTKDVEGYVFRTVPTLQGKLSPGIGVLTDLSRNSDFYGVQIRNDRDGKLAQGIQMFGWYAEQYYPVAFRKRNEFDDAGLQLGPLAFTWQRWVGFMPAPMWTTRSAAIQKAFELRGKKVAGVEKTRVEQKSRDARQYVQGLIVNMTRDVQLGKNKEAKEAEAKITEFKKKYPKEFDRAAANVISKETGQLIPPLVQALQNLGLAEILEVRKEAVRDELPFIDDYVRRKVAKMREQYWQQRGADKPVTVDTSLIEKALKIIGDVK